MLWGVLHIFWSEMQNTNILHIQGKYVFKHDMDWAKSSRDNNTVWLRASSSISYKSKHTTIQQNSQHPGRVVPSTALQLLLLCICFRTQLLLTLISSNLNPPRDANVSIIRGVVSSLKALEERGHCEKYASQIYTCWGEAKGRRTAFLCRMHTLPNPIYSRNDYASWTLSLLDFYKHILACVAIVHPSKY